MHARFHDNAWLTKPVGNVPGAWCCHDCHNIAVSHLPGSRIGHTFARLQHGPMFIGRVLSPCLAELGASCSGTPDGPCHSHVWCRCCSRHDEIAGAIGFQFCQDTRNPVAESVQHLKCLAAARPRNDSVWRHAAPAQRPANSPHQQRPGDRNLSLAGPASATLTHEC